MKYTDVITLPCGPLPMLREVRHHLRSRPGVVTTVVELEFEWPGKDFIAEVRELSEEAEAALAALVLLLDDRIAYRREGEMVQVTRPDGGTLFCDVTRGVRSYDTDLERRVGPEPILQQAPALPLDQDPSASAALRCYLAAIEQVKTPVGFILLCSALEALCPTKSQSFNKNQLIAALKERGIDVKETDMIDIVRVRAMVHHGFVEDPLLHPSWSTLETLVRTALRQVLDVRYGWPRQVPTTKSNRVATHEVFDVDLEERHTNPPAESVRTLAEGGLTSAAEARRLVDDLLHSRDQMCDHLG
ncbi:hypothetical protein [uncultured Serinicoccus sp.]|uniref:hypothetical protein n=1 Tax=uncultured Serinicoccus sp. TaxID=735514 RepID=UPI002613EAC9|nr:hypothetical protein [uncultured Serinicoccus sp.]